MLTCLNSLANVKVSSFWEFIVFDRLLYFRDQRWQAEIEGREAPLDPVLAGHDTEAAKVLKEEARKAFQQLSGMERRMYEALGDLDFEKAKECARELHVEERRAARAAGWPWYCGGIPRVRIPNKTRMRRRCRRG